MHLKGVIESTGILADRKVAKREWNRILKRGLRVMLRRWHQKYLPRHFAEARVVTQRYPRVFRPRSAKYQARKRRQKGHGKLLVWSGETERAVRGGQRVGGTSTRAWLEVRWPSKTRQTRSGAYRSAPTKNIAAELTAISRMEDRELTKELERWVVKQIAKVRVKKRHRR